MGAREDQEQKVQRIIRAFQAKDPPFVANPVRDLFTYEGRVGVRASNSSAPGWIWRLRATAIPPGRASTR